MCEQSALSQKIKKNITVEYCFSSEDLSIHELKRKVLDVLEKRTNLPHRDIMRFTIAVEEAVFNALEHGNLELKSAWKEEYPGGQAKTLFEMKKQERLITKKFYQRKITIQVNINTSFVEISIKDDGKGFKVGDVGKRVTGRPHGMGLTLIRNLVDEMKFNKKGNQIIMIKKQNNNESINSR